MRKHVTPGLIGVLVLILPTVAGCRCSPTPRPPDIPAVADAVVVATHAPMHPGDSEAVTFAAKASGTVDRIVLAYERHALSTAPGGSHEQTLVEALTMLVECDPEGTVASLPCEMTLGPGFPANSLITFHATAYDSEGRTASESYSFAAGEYPWPSDPIPIRVNGDPREHLDIVFIPDTDISIATFRESLVDVLETLYFKYDVIQSYRTLYNFYYSEVAGDYEETCNFTDPANMANLTVVADTVAILHESDLRDCRSGSRMSSEIDYDKTLIHESGHALFDLRDEYCCDSSYSQQACVPNLWNSLAACEADSAELGYAASDCAQLTKGNDSVNYWRIDPTGSAGCMMGTSMHNAGSDFGQACLRRIRFRYERCLAGDCYPWPDCP